MEIRPVALPIGVPSVPTRDSIPPPGQSAAVAEIAVKAAASAFEAAQSTERAEGPRVTKVRAELLFDESIKRVVGRIFDQETGQTLYEIPPEELKQLYARTREQLASLLDETA